MRTNGLRLGTHFFANCSRAESMWRLHVAWNVDSSIASGRSRNSSQSITFNFLQRGVLFRSMRNRRDEIPEDRFMPFGKNFGHRWIDGMEIFLDEFLRLNERRMPRFGENGDFLSMLKFFSGCFFVRLSRITKNEIN